MSNWFDTLGTDIQNFFVETEADVEKIVVWVKQEVVVAENALISAAKWIAANGPTIAADLTTAATIAEQIGVTANPQFAAAVAAANVAVAGLNAFANAANNPTTTSALGQAVVDGYAAYQAAKGAIANAKAAAAQAPTKAAA